MRGIVKRFGDVVALDGVDLALQRGEIHALLGENGAGTIAVEGGPGQVRAPRDSLRRGIGMVHQHFELVAQFTALENVILGREGAVWLRRSRARAAVQQLAAQYGITLDLDARGRTPPLGVPQEGGWLKAPYRAAAS